MRLYVCDNGQLYNVKAEPTDSIAALNQTCAVSTDIPTKAQILLTADGITLVPSKTVADYPSLKDPNAVVFLFNRNRVIRGGEPDSKAASTENSDCAPSPDTSSTPRAEGSCLDPLLRSRSLDQSSSSLGFSNPRGRYRDHFARQLKYARGHLENTRRRLEECNALASKQDIQSQALEAALRNLGHHKNSMLRDFTNFRREYKALASHNEKHVFATFEARMTALRGIALDPCLQNSDRRTLFDMVPEARLRKWLDKCRRTQSHLGSSVEALARRVDAVDSSDAERSAGAIRDILRAVHGDISRAEAAQQQQAACVATLENNLRWVDEKAQGLNSQSENGQGATPDHKTLAEALASKDQHHCDSLHRLGALGEIATAALAKLRASKVRVRREFYASLRSVSELQGRIRALGRKFGLHREASSKLGSDCEKFKHLRDLPNVYKTCLSELRRRQAFRSAFLAHIKSFQKVLARSHAAEAGARRKFADECWEYLTPDFFPVLRHAPPKVDINLRGLNKLPEAVAAEQGKVDTKTPGAAATGLPPTYDELQSMVSDLKEELRVERSALERSRRESSEHMSRLSSLKSDKARLAERMEQVLKSHAETRSRADLLSSKAILGAQMKLNQAKARVEDAEARVRESQKNSANVEKKFHAEHEQRLAAERTAAAKIQELERNIETMSRKTALLLRQNKDLKRKQDAKESWKEIADARIAFKNFQVQDTVLFERDTKGHYVAFNVAAPNRFLSRECEALLADTEFAERKKIIGKIVEMNKFTATGASGGNPFSLASGTEFYEITAEIVPLSPGGVR